MDAALELLKSDAMKIGIGRVGMVSKRLLIQTFKTQEAASEFYRKLGCDLVFDPFPASEIVDKGVVRCIRRAPPPV